MHPTGMELPSPRLQMVGRWPTLDEAYEHALVILAQGLDCSVHPVGGGYGLVTSAEHSEIAEQELTAYSDEQSISRPSSPAASFRDHPPGIPWLLGWALTLVVIHLLQERFPDITGRFSNASLPIFQNNEWWRPFTALFLHGDLLHLCGNLFIGGIFCLMVARSVGALSGWLMILLGGTLGNALNAFLHRAEPFASIGASTATFAALGILVGLAIVELSRSGAYHRLKALAVPLLAGIILFSWFGTSGEQTDIGGHALGSLCGLTLGIGAGWLSHPSEPHHGT